MAKPDTRRVDVDLNRLRLTRFRVEFHIRKATADDDEGVTLFKRLLGRRRAEQADAAGRIRTVIWNDRLAEQGFRDRRAHFLREFRISFLAFKHPRPAKIATL